MSECASTRYKTSASVPDITVQSAPIGVSRRNGQGRTDHRRPARRRGVPLEFSERKNPTVGTDGYPGGKPAGRAQCSFDLFLYREQRSIEEVDMNPCSGKVGARYLPRSLRPPFGGVKG